MVSSVIANSTSKFVREQNRLRFNEFAQQFNSKLMIPQLLVSFLGIIGNVLALIIINRKSLRNTSSAVFITYLAIFDSAVLFLHAIDLIVSKKHIIMHCALPILTDFFTLGANWILVIITIERCIAVYWPFLSKRLCTIHSARHSIYTLFTILLVSFLVTTPLLFEISGFEKNRKCTLSGRYRLLLRLAKPIIFYGIPDIFLLSNLFTVYALCQRHRDLSLLDTRDRASHESRICDPHSNRKQRQLTVMLIAVSLSFYLFTTPATVSYILEWFPPARGQLKEAKQRFIFSQISVLILQGNNSTNFLFYCFAGQRFRQATSHTFREWYGKMRYFFYRYLVRDRQYQSPMVPEQAASYAMNHTITTRRDSCSPFSNVNRQRTSTF